MDNADMPFGRLLADLPDVLTEDPVFVDELISHTRIITIKKGDLLLRSGELCKDAYFINKGLFVNIFITETGKNCVTGFSSDYQFPFLSEIGYYTKTASDFEIKALEDSELLCFSREFIEDLSLRYPFFASYYQTVMLKIISKFYMMFAVLQTYTAEEFIMYLYEHYKWIILRVPDKYIALYMGISTSWYCKLKKKIFSFSKNTVVED